MEAWDDSCVQDLAVPFTLRGEAGTVLVSVEPNTDPLALGCGLLDEEEAAESALGFPVCRARVQYRPEGYAAAMGWIQLVRSTDGEDPNSYELDPLALLRDVDTPYAFFGIAPELFDAPFRGRRVPLTWQARSFLCASPDAVMSRTALPLCAFTWGFTITESDGVPAVVPPEPLPTTTWAEHVALLERAHPAWRFRRQPSDTL